MQAAPQRGSGSPIPHSHIPNIRLSNHIANDLRSSDNLAALYCRPGYDTLDCAAKFQDYKSRCPLWHAGTHGSTLNEILRTLCGATAGPSKVIIIDFEGDLWTTDLYMMLETLESLELWLEENENIWLRLRGQHMTRYPYIYDERYVDVDDANEQKWLSFLRAYESRFLPPDGLHHSVEYYG
jgi:hypothetical protein